MIALAPLLIALTDLRGVGVFQGCAHVRQGEDDVQKGRILTGHHTSAHLPEVQ
jgi:hypothetical protein